MTIRNTLTFIIVILFSIPSISQSKIDGYIIKNLQDTISVEFLVEGKKREEKNNNYKEVTANINDSIYTMTAKDILGY